MVIIVLQLLKNSNRVKKDMSKKEGFIIIIGPSDLYFKASYSAVVSLSCSSNVVTKDDHISSIRHSQSLICCWICAMCAYALTLTFFSSHMCISGDFRQILVYTILQ